MKLEDIYDLIEQEIEKMAEAIFDKLHQDIKKTKTYTK